MYKNKGKTRNSFEMIFKKIFNAEMEPDRIFVYGRIVFEAELAKIRSRPARSVPALILCTCRTSKNNMQLKSIENNIYISSTDFIFYCIDRKRQEQHE
jgi:hypothetical protein